MLFRRFPLIFIMSSVDSLVSSLKLLGDFHGLDEDLTDELHVHAELVVTDDVLDTAVAVVTRGADYSAPVASNCSALTRVLSIRSIFQGGPQLMVPPPAPQQ